MGTRWFVVRHGASSRCWPQVCCWPAARQGQARRAVSMPRRRRPWPRVRRRPAATERKSGSIRGCRRKIAAPNAAPEQAADSAAQAAELAATAAADGKVIRTADLDVRLDVEPVPTTGDGAADRDAAAAAQAAAAAGAAASGPGDRHRRRRFPGFGRGWRIAVHDQPAGARRPVRLRPGQAVRPRRGDQANREQPRRHRPIGRCRQQGQEHDRERRAGAGAAGGGNHHRRRDSIEGELAARKRIWSRCSSRRRRSTARSPFPPSV